MLFYAHPAGVVLGLVGLVLNFIPSYLGFRIAVSTGLVDGLEIANNVGSYLTVEAVNACIWGGVYGWIGYRLDRVRQRKAGS